MFVVSQEKKKKMMLLRVSCVAPGKAVLYTDVKPSMTAGCEEAIHGHITKVP